VTGEPTRGQTQGQGPGQPRELRIGDADRTAAAEELAEHYAQGRISPEEHSDRLDRIWAAKTRADLTPVFTDLPGSAYRAPTAYASADRPAIGQDRTRGGRPYPTPPFGRPPFGRPPFGRPPYTGDRRPTSWFGALPVLIRVLLVAALVVLVIGHLPLILIGVVVWAVLAHRGGAWRHQRAHQRRW
jgi:hypothetical protein